MANPSLKNGYTPIANELLEAVAACRLNGTQMRILLLLWRNSYGFHKDACALPLSYLVRATGANKSSVSRELSRLVKMRIVARTVSESAKITGTRCYRFLKDYTKWRHENGEPVCVFADTKIGKKEVCKNENGGLSVFATNKDNKKIYKNIYRAQKNFTPKKKSRYNYAEIERRIFQNMARAAKEEDAK